MQPKRIGIIAEFDPFHNGHKYLLESVKRKYDPDQIVVVMSQDVVQRGKFASFDKWWRAKTAVENGTDLVVGLPAVVSNNSAEFFAKGSVDLLKTLNIDALAFGCESTDLEALRKTAHLLNNESTAFKEILRDELKKGLSYPRARQNALGKVAENLDTSLLTKPNAILGIEYLKQLDNSPQIKALPLRRQGDHFNNEENSKFLSSSEIRSRLKDEKDVQSYIPYPQEDLMGHYLKTDDTVFFNLLISQLLRSSKEELLEINEINEDIVNKLLKIPGNCFNLEEVYFYLKKKNNTYAGISRILANIVLGIKKSEVLDYFNLTKPYHRILAFNENGKNILKESDAKLINVAKDEKKLNIFQKQSFDLDKRVLDFRNLIQKERSYKDDYYKKPFIKYG